MKSKLFFLKAHLYSADTSGDFVIRSKEQLHSETSKQIKTLCFLAYFLNIMVKIRISHKWLGVPVCHFKYGVLSAGQTKKRKCLDWTRCLENGNLCVSRHSGTCFAGLVGNNINPICQSLFDLERVPLHSGTHKCYYCMSLVLICRTVCCQLRPLGVGNIKHWGSETNLKVCSTLFVNCFARNVHFIFYFLRRKGCKVQGMEWEERQLQTTFLLLWPGDQQQLSL